MWGFLIFVVIVSLAVIFRSGWRPSWPRRNHNATATPAHDNEHGGHDEHAAPDSGRRGSEKTGFFVWTLRFFVLILAAIIIFGFASCVSKCNGSSTSTTYVYTAPPPPVYVPCRGEWGFRTLDIPAEGLPVYLCQGWKDWPIGGPITITPQGGGKPLDDQPGATNHFGYTPDGMYIIRANPVGSTRQIQLYNQW